MNDCNHAQCKQVHQLLDGMLEMLNLPAMEGIVSVGKAVVVCEEIKRLSADYQGMKKQLADLSDMMAMRLSAISAASYQNTDATRKERIDRRNDYWTPAYGDVCAAVDREIAIKRNAAWTCALHAYPYGFSEDGPHDPVCPWCERLEVEQLQEKLAAAHEKLAEIGRERSEWKREAIELRKEVAAATALTSKTERFTTTAVRRKDNHEQA